MMAAIAGRPSIEAASSTLLSDPLDFLFAEHFRHRKLCNLLEELALATRQQTPLAGEVLALAREVLAFLCHDMEVHVQDEELDLFPLLRLRSVPEDGSERVLSALAAEHAGDRHLANLVISGLQRVLAEGRPRAQQTGLREAMIDLARNERRHLALENAIVLPLARRRLEKADLAELSARMMRRREAKSLGVVR
jgi:hemerythrin-like domain-containing protein